MHVDCGRKWDLFVITCFRERGEFFDKELTEAETVCLGCYCTCNLGDGLRN